MIVPLSTTPSEENKGHIVLSESGTTNNVIIQTVPDNATIQVANNIEYVIRVASSLAAIIGVDNSKIDIKNVLSLKEDLRTIVDNKADISRLASISDELNILADNISPLENLVTDIDTVKEVERYLKEISFLYAIRNELVNLSSIKDKLNTLFAHIDVFKKIQSKLTQIELVYDHLLAIEVVANNIENIETFNANIETFNSLVEMKGSIDKFIDSTLIAKELIYIVHNLPETLDTLKSELNTAGENMTNNFKAQSDQVIKEFNDKLSKFDKECLEITKSSLSIDKALSDFKVETVNRLSEVKENILAVELEKIKDLSKIKDDIASIKAQQTTTNQDTSSDGGVIGDEDGSNENSDGGII
ncbi:hypothetical protein CFT13S00388_02555 [Campylobacter fetus subsp. testudinum]|uniref:hypothetical protein n=1 Tax=Campylobacter fetus TaxID=196 RepID=UPI000818C75F|nr:hypothetical protein [Campylobacter fetus]OCR88067.1 hypothetical protein CFT13S00388_02555 [Campylobacter fetus subsp. testudinum]